VFLLLKIKVIIKYFKLLRIKTVAIASIIILIDAMATAIL